MAVLADDPRGPLLATVYAKGLPLAASELRGSGETVLVTFKDRVELRGLVALQQLGVLVCQPGRVSMNVLAAAGNLVTLRSPVMDGHVAIGGTVVVPGVPKVVGGSRLARIPFTAEIGAARLCAAKPAPRHAGTDADPVVLQARGEVDTDDFPVGTPVLEVPKGDPLALSDRPAAPPFFVRPGADWGFTTVRLSTDGQWDQVVLGEGPYIVGWTRTRAPDHHVGDPMGGLGIVGTLSETDVNLHAAMDLLASAPLRSLPLHEVPAGTELAHHGTARARLITSGFARVVRTEGALAYVVAAVDGSMTVEGWLPSTALGRRMPARLSIGTKGAR